MFWGDYVGANGGGYGGQGRMRWYRGREKVIYEGGGEILIMVTLLELVRVSIKMNEN